MQAHGVLPAALADSAWLCAYPILTGGACFTLGSYLAWAAAERTPWLPLHSALSDRDSTCKALYLVVGLVLSKAGHARHQLLLRPSAWATARAIG